MRSGKLIIAEGDGPTAIINHFLVGAILEARLFPQIERVYGARYGVRGIVDEDFVDLSMERANLEAVAATPSSALGSTRDKPDVAYCRHFKTRNERVGLAFRVAAIWCAMLLCIFLLYDSSVQGVLNANASSLAMMTLVALVTFAAGIQAQVWQICGGGTLLFLAVPGVGWLHQSPFLLAAVTFAIVVLAALVWWVKQIQSSSEAKNALTPVVDAGGESNASHGCV